MDEFIDKLLASKKFDMLAEKFAQKAVERMINIQPNLRFSKDFSAQINAPQKITFKNVSYKTDVHLEKKSSPLRNLSLKFKYFTKGAFYNIQSDENKEIIHVKEITETDIENTTNKENKLKTEEDDDDEGDDETINLSDLETSFQQNHEKTNISLKYKHFQTNNEKISNQNRTKEHQEKANDGSISIENKRNAALLSEIDVPEDHKRNESHVNGFTSDFDNNVKKDRALFSKESNEATKYTVSEKELKKRFHKEGNRLYTFQSSSDYDEYHHELERVEKERQVFV